MGMVRAPEGKTFVVKGFKWPWSFWIYRDDQPPLPLLATHDLTLAAILLSGSQGPPGAEVSTADLSLDDLLKKCVGEKNE